MEGVAHRMAVLAAAHDGWMNLLPGVPEEDVPAPSVGPFTALFGSGDPPVSMCTWMPPGGPGTRRAGVETVGIMHARGRGAVAQIASAGAAVPPGWTVRQDHVKRGLIVHPASGTSHGAVLAWMIAAGAALSTIPLTGRWKARFYLPV